MKAKTISLVLSALFGAASSSPFAAPISFQQAWELLQESNNSLAAGRANVERYQHIKNSTDNLNLPSVTLGANYTRLDQDITLSGKQLFDSTGQSISPSLALRSELFGLFLLADELMPLSQQRKVGKKRHKAS